MWNTIVKKKPARRLANVHNWDVTNKRKYFRSSWSWKKMAKLLPCLRKPYDRPESVLAVLKALLKSNLEPLLYNIYSKPKPPEVLLLKHLCMMSDGTM